MEGHHDDENIGEGLTSSSDDKPVEVKSISNVTGETPQGNPKPKNLWGWKIFVILFGVYIVFNLMTLVNISMRFSPAFNPVNPVKHDLFNYIKKHEHLPPAEKWCDALVEEDDSHLEYEKNNKEHFPCKLNKHIYEHKELPDNMVVAFSVWGGYGWNLIGDYEQAKNYDRTVVLFGNGDSRSFGKKFVPYLRWKYEDSGVIPEIDVKTPFLMISALLAIISLPIVIVCRDSIKIFWRIAVGIGIISASAGVILGLMTDSLYGIIFNPPHNMFALWFSGIWSFIIGICFIGLLGKIYTKHRANVIISSYAIVLGPMAGIAASSCIHGYLMIAYGVTSFDYMHVGACFGIVTGGILGLISSGLIGLYKNKVSIQNDRK